MRYSEFKREVDALSSNYVVRKELANIFDEDIISVWYKEQPIMKISGTYQFVMQKFYLMDSTPFSHKLYMLAAELAMTPIEERNDPEKYYVQVIKGVVDGYLNSDRADRSDFCIGLTTENFKWQSAFTEEEINKLKANPNLAIDWDKVALEKVSEYQMTKQRKHTKKSAIKKKARRMREHAKEHSRKSLSKQNLSSGCVVQ